MSWIAGIFELFGVWLVGNRNRLGFLLNIVGCILWCIIAVYVPGARGILLVAIPAIFINIINYFKWRELSHKKRDITEEDLRRILK
jgi:nicotinamide riboside transporter PnuC